MMRKKLRVVLSVYVPVALCIAPFEGVAEAEEEPLRAVSHVSQPGPIWSSAVHLVSASSTRLTQVSPSSGNVSKAGLGLITTGAVFMGVGAGLGFYGTSDTCYAGYPIATCDKYVNGGIALLVGGLATFIVGAVVHSNAKRAASAPPLYSGSDSELKAARSSSTRTPSSAQLFAATGSAWNERFATSAGGRAK